MGVYVELESTSHRRAADPIEDVKDLESDLDAQPEQLSPEDELDRLVDAERDEEAVQLKDCKSAPPAPDLLYEHNAKRGADASVEEHLKSDPEIP